MGEFVLEVDVALEDIFFSGKAGKKIKIPKESEKKIAPLNELRLSHHHKVGAHEGDNYGEGWRTKLQPKGEEVVHKGKWMGCLIWHLNSWIDRHNRIPTLS